jgi:putative ABC transport system substrate-binding protein
MMTGLTVVPSEIIGKNFEIVRDIVSGLRSIGFLFRPDTPVGVRAEPAARAAAQQLGLAYAAFPMRSIDEVKAAFSSGDVDAIFTVADPLVSANLATLAELAIAARKPVVTTYRGYTAGGFLASYGPDLPDIWRRIGGYAAKILAGANPSDLPVEMPSKLLLVINLKTAKALKITVPERLLALADEVIE